MIGRHRSGLDAVRPRSRAMLHLTTAMDAGHAVGQLPRPSSSSCCSAIVARISGLLRRRRAFVISCHRFSTIESLGLSEGDPGA